MSQFRPLSHALLAVLPLLGLTPVARAQTITYGPILGRGATPDQMIVKWGTDTSTGPSSLAYRQMGNGAFAAATGTESQNSSKTFDHETVLTGLSLDTAYDYQVTAGSKVQTKSFSTCPQPGKPMDMVFYGDSRNQLFSTAGQAEHLKIVEQVLAKAPDMVFESGDLVFTGAYSDYLHQFFPVVAQLAETVPFMAVPGNHDNGDPFDLDTGGLSVLTNNFGVLFPSPQADPGNWTPYYSFVCGNAMFIGLNSESVVANASGDTAQMTFLTKQLAAARTQSSIDHVLVWFHHSPYSSAGGLFAHGDNATVQKEWVPLFDDPANKVTAVFTGHDHIYARMNDGSHVVYVVSGGAGASAASVGGSSKAHTDASKSAYNFVALHIAGPTATGTAFDDTGAAFDTWTMQSTNTSSSVEVPLSLQNAAGCSIGATAPIGREGLAALVFVLACLLLRRPTRIARS
jgi:3',5'-cyclic AMP phosphodiesterase CpdA